MINITKLEKSLRLELTKSEPSLVVLKAEHLQETHYFTQKLDTISAEIPYPSDAFKEGTVKGVVFPLFKDIINTDVLWDVWHTNIYQPLAGFSNGEVPPPGDWVIGKAVIEAKARYHALKAKKKKKMKKKPAAPNRHGRGAFPAPNVGGLTGGSAA
jgi:hypothetical protein